MIAATVAGFALAAPQVAAADPAVEGSWGPLQQYPVVPVSMGVMPDGKIVAWDQANKPPDFGSVPNSGAAMVLDPGTGQVTRSANLAPRTTFCSLIATLPDGQLAVIGGGSDSGGGATRDVQLYDADSKTFSVLGQMNERRWYPGGTLDREGNMVVAGGTSTGIEEVNQRTGVSTTLNTTFPANWYADLIRTPSDSFLIEDVGDNAAAGAGRFMLSGTNLSSLSDRSLLQTRRRGIRTMIGPHTMFYNSGGTSRDSLIIDASSGTPRFTRAATSGLRHMTGQAVTLPTGDVLAVGGNSSGSDTKGTPVMTPELYSPATDSWTEMADMARRRTYHSVAALLPDGRIWSAGSSFDEVQEPNGQFFSPPYLYRRDGSGQLASRPAATDAPEAVGAGETFSIATNTPGEIAQASFIRMAATTHQVNTGQAFVPLGVTARSGRVEMRAPSVDEAPPGYYMVFLVNEDGVPSVAPVVRLHESGATAPQPRVVQSSQNAVSTPAWNAFDGNPAQGTSAKISRTLTEAQPWWQVDLGEARDLDNVRVRLPDCCASQNRDLWVFASDEPLRSTTVDSLRAQPGVTSVRMQTPTGTVGNVALDRSARYLRIQAPAQSVSLALAEVELIDNQRPTVSLTSPANGASFTAPASYQLAANASDTDGQVTKVDFFRGSTPIGTDTSAPFTASESGVAAGNYSLTARATDSSGDATTSAPVAITVEAPEPPADTGPVAAYAFDEGSGSTLGDRTGNGHDGAIAGADWTTQGHSGRALSFAGGADMVTVPDHADLDLTDGFTIEAWVKPRTIDYWRTVAIKESPPGALSYGLYASSDAAGHASSGTASGAVSSSEPTPVGVWSHLATTYEDGTLRIYVDGQLTGTATSVSPPEASNGALRIGGNAIWDFETFDGLIDDVRIYARGLSEAEVRADRDTPVAPPPSDDPPPPPGPQPTLELSFDEGSGSVAGDTSGNRHDGAISGASWVGQGHSGNALSFDGDDDRVTVADHADLDLGDTFTIESWVMPRTLNGWKMAVLKEAPPNTLSYALYASAGGGPIPNAWTSGGGAVSPYALPVGSWAHLATTYDHGTMRVYVNRQLVAVETGLGAPANTAGPLRIGGNAIWDFETFDGLIDEVRIYREALSPDELAGGGGALSGATRIGKRLQRGCVAKAKWVKVKRGKKAKSKVKVKQASCKKKRKKRG